MFFPLFKLWITESPKIFKEIFKDNFHRNTVLSATARTSLATVNPNLRPITSKQLSSTSRSGIIRLAVLSSMTLVSIT